MEGTEFGFMKKFKLATAVSAVCIGMNIVSFANTQYTVSSGDDLQSIIDSCNDSAYNRVEIYMQPGTYGPITAISNMGLEPRYIDFIGMGMVIVESDDGIYSSPAAELRLDGKVENINFVATHKNSEVPEGDTGAYAVHADYGTQRTEFINCTFTSEQTASVGMGLTSESEVTFSNCKFMNRAKSDSTTLWDLGALYVHTDFFDENKTGAKLNLYGCSFESPMDSSAQKVNVEELKGSSIELNVS